MIRNCFSNSFLKKFSGGFKGEIPPSVEVDFTTMSDTAVCQSVYLWVTELLDHPFTDMFTSKLGSNQKYINTTPNEYLDEYLLLMRQFATKFRTSLKKHQTIPVTVLNELSRKSLDMKRKYSWSIPTPEALNKIKEHLPIVEIGAGTGYWAHCLERSGVSPSELLCFDCSSTWLPYLNDYQDGSACAVDCCYYSALQQGPPDVVSNHNDKTLLLMWPDFMGLGDFGHQTLMQYSGSTIITVGEWSDATLGAYSPDLQNTFSGQSFSTAFQLKVSREFDLIDTISLPSWPLYCDQLRVFKRKSEPQSSTWTISTSPILGRYMTAENDIPAGNEVLADEPLLHFIEQEEDESKYEGMYRAATTEKESLAKFVAAGLQCTGEENAHTQLLSIIKQSVGPKADTLRHWKQLVQVGSCFHYNGFGGLNAENNMELRVFGNISFCNHSCAPNCVVIPNEGSLRSITAIPKGTPITISYLDDKQLLLPTNKRRQLLQSRWGFICGCERCSQPFDDVRIFTVGDDISQPTTSKDEDPVTFSDSDGDVIALRACRESKSIIYSINGEDRPMSKSIYFNRLTSTLHLLDIDREIEIPSTSIIPSLFNLSHHAGIDDCTSLSLIPGCKTVGCCNWFGRYEEMEGKTVIKCTACGNLFDDTVTKKLIDEENQALSSSDEDVVGKFVDKHVIHWLSHSTTVDKREGALMKQLAVTQMQRLYWNDHAERAINNYAADQFASLAEALTINNEHDEAAAAYNSQLNLRSVNDIQTGEWGSVSACQPNASVLNFLFKD
eukprot:TRINITY_DN8949_c3_g1_i1.p1 TRINITY_DN8949_c3_g1~~TRINITY_DN8949_c3_g1_i1.p1  ORF type:complete len:808 (+),score=149.83 TRINITY_DN8949_c3_g1_i1:84-2426(+)